MFKIIVLEKDSFQIVDNHIDGPVGGVPNLCVVGSPGCVDADQHEGFLKIRDAGLGLPGNGFVDHPNPVFFYRSGQLLEAWQRLRNQQSDNAITAIWGNCFCCGCFYGRAEIHSVVHNAKDLALQLSDTLNVPLEVWLGIEDYAPADVSPDAYEVARAYDRADFRDKNMARMALKLELLKEEKV